MEILPSLVMETSVMNLGRKYEYLSRILQNGSIDYCENLVFFRVLEILITCYDYLIRSKKLKLEGVARQWAVKKQNGNLGLPLPFDSSRVL